MIQNKQFFTQLTQWHNDDEYLKIIHTITDLSESDINDELKGQLARAYNNVNRYDSAIKILNQIPEKHRNDIWNFRIGFAYFYKKDYRNALDSFSACHGFIKENDEDTFYFISRSQKATQFRPLSKKMIADVIEILNNYKKNNQDLDYDNFLEEIKTIGLSDFQIGEVVNDIDRAQDSIDLLAAGMNSDDFEENVIFDTALSFFIQ